MEQGQATSTVETTEAEADERGGFGSLGSIILLLALTWAAGIASFPLNDNSFFTHLATGRIILEEGSVPTTDPYTFTAAGEPWTVQSWLASVAYAGAEQLAGDVGLRILVLAVFLTAMTLLLHLLRPARSVFVQVFVVACLLFIVTDVWSVRPYMVGAIGLALVWMAMEGEIPWWTMLPAMWVWTNSHASFPLAMVLALTLLVGASMDQRSSTNGPVTGQRELRVVGAIALGSLLGAIGPLGLDVLLFPLKAIASNESFTEIIEWQAPRFRSFGELAFLALAMAAILSLLRTRSWTIGLPAVVFLVAALTAQRNIVMAVVVLVAVVARSAPEVGSLRERDRPVLGHVVAAFIAAGLLGVATLTVLLPVHGFGGYPVRAVAWLSATGVSSSSPEHIVAEVHTGNLLEVLDGPTAQVFVDDRFDALPADVIDDLMVLDEGRLVWDQVLSRHEADLVVWNRTEPLSSLLAASAGWRIVYSDTGWIVAEPRT